MTLEEMKAQVLKKKQQETEEGEVSLTNGGWIKKVIKNGVTLYQPVYGWANAGCYGDPDNHCGWVGED